MASDSWNAVLFIRAAFLFTFHNTETIMDKYFPSVSSMDKQKRNYTKAFATVIRKHGEAFAWLCSRLHRIFKSMLHTAFSYVIDYDRLSEEICPAELAQWIDHEQVAGCFQVDWIAEEINLEDLAGHIEMKDLASEIDLSDLSEYYDAGDIADYFDASDIAQCFAESIDAEDVASYVPPHEVSNYMEIDYSEIDIDYEVVAEYIDPEAMAKGLASVEGAMEEVASYVNAKHVAKFVQDPWSMMVTPFEKEH